MHAITVPPVDLDALLAEFAAQADAWFSQRPFVGEFYQFIQEFFRPEQLQKAEWPQFQELASHLNALNSIALAKANAFGHPNYPIAAYREAFLFLAHGEGSEEERMRAFMGDKEAYASKYLGNSVVSELMGQLCADRFVFMNRRDIEAAKYLGLYPTFPAKTDFPAQFTAFNTALAPLFQAYQRIVGCRPGNPIGLEVDQFLSWLYETKVPKKANGEGKSSAAGRQIWVMAPGPQAKYWDECRTQSIVRYGADSLGPIDVFASKDAICQQLKSLGMKDSEPTNDALGAWEFCQVMKEGDLIIAKKGNRTIVGVGVVRGGYRYDSSRSTYANFREVEWTHQGEWLLPDGETFATKALTNITAYKEFATMVLETVGLKPEDTAGPRYFWLNCLPSLWQVSASAVGEEKTFTTHSEKGNKRTVFACFQTVKPGDLIIGYETTPVQKVTTILGIAQGVHETEDQGECIRFKVMQQLEQPRSLNDLRQEPVLANCGPLLGNHTGSLFQLTKAEYDAILSQDVLPDPGDEIDPLPDNGYTVEDALGGLFVSEFVFQEWLRQWRTGKNLILQGAPGVGKTFVARRLAYALMEAEDPSRVAMVQFHQAYGYEDFVQGYRPGPNGFELRKGVFYDFCLKAKESPTNQPFVFIIDEINRGNLSRIFGELLMLTEPDKRGEKHAMRLAYQAEGQTFFVPENVYILGMMNTADRSLAVVDYALRRRFRFATLVPAFGTTGFREHLTESCGADLADRIILRMEWLNDTISKDLANLGPGFCIGHSYFCPIKSLDDYREVIHFQIAPLLREYWFDAPKQAEEAIQKLVDI